MSISVKFFNIEELNKAYDILENITPLYGDCGKLCSCKCCSGSDKDGMLLLPGEEELFYHLSGYHVYYDDKYKSYAVSCQGTCNRKVRPFSCRIFPFFPYVKNDGKYSSISVAPDIRALDFCNILTEDIEVTKKYLRALRISARILCQNEDIRQYLARITDIITDLGGLY